MKVKMIATADHVYDGKQLHANDEFQADEQYVKTLELLGRAKRVVQQRRTYRRRDMQAQA